MAKAGFAMTGGIDEAGRMKDGPAKSTSGFSFSRVLGALVK
jgi:hypothetical protein